ncbi:uncharacterized protein PHACADRAFT_251296 [Phanerochaete carnosa HHB-10118-sp]|uniref:Uncharacterized protein n=1 Tax=Phanerochaete carnosa (strain HHB-10118-sp) TaxID=650164 RepID=K5WE70_PHACS|nr:uncharacterized protein PHACADRAFT_251296 [Phanerochaete carnosa HHB-10118-sp]EKM57595.1 hypothetical protein PHACADRAFT_251296 [Phanerochaete carnosa HHB-10118-sp]
MSLDRRLRSNLLLAVYNMIPEASEHEQWFAKWARYTAAEVAIPFIYRGGPLGHHVHTASTRTGGNASSRMLG